MLFKPSLIVGFAAFALFPPLSALRCSLPVGPRRLVNSEMLARRCALPNGAHATEPLRLIRAAVAKSRIEREMGPGRESEAHDASRWMGVGGRGSSGSQLKARKTRVVRK